MTYPESEIRRLQIFAKPDPQAAFDDGNDLCNLIAYAEQAEQRIIEWQTKADEMTLKYVGEHTAYLLQEKRLAALEQQLAQAMKVVEAAGMDDEDRSLYIFRVQQALAQLNPTKGTTDEK